MMNYIYPALLTFLVLQCQKEPGNQPNQHTAAYAVSDGVQFGQEFTVERLEHVIVYGGETPRRLHVSARQLADSRCPADVMCVQYGKATVVLSASNSQGENDSIELCLGDCGEGANRSAHIVQATVGESIYSFTLREVQPFPGLEKEGEVQKARLVVEKVKPAAK
ncbi:hypothetical protein DXT99_13745 [Pontibacter diazotrophicus]|uniref:Uncharacterized protein n=1 Tax=Pontibacter diazotrophicus TaxID=1400979 RepID=A0A3D8LBA2_9BACT|nr:hypothetical protein [Pontibacter diazotrophicus]RDV14721.1 hypothetical protein DXT99_13745 [Pontibacter diazotrophicus]